MARKKLENRLIPKDEILESLGEIEGSDVDFITPSGKVYQNRDNNLYLPKTTFINKHNGYLYVSIKLASGKQVQRRVHILVAKAFIPNPDNYTIVMHKDNIKSNPDVSNLKWGTVSENTRNAFRDGLIKNASGEDDSQSIPVCIFDIDSKELLMTFGSISEASKYTGVTKSGILYQCNHKLKTKPKCKYYFRYESEFNKSGFVL